MTSSISQRQLLDLAAAKHSYSGNGPRPKTSAYSSTRKQSRARKGVMA